MFIHGLHWRVLRNLVWNDFPAYVRVPGSGRHYGTASRGNKSRQTFSSDVFGRRTARKKLRYTRCTLLGGFAENTTGKIYLGAYLRYALELCNPGRASSPTAPLRTPNIVSPSTPLFSTSAFA